MKIHILSDLHNEFALYNPHQVNADVVVLAGDIDVRGRAIEWAKFSFPDQQVLYVAGNHEFYSDAYPDLLDKMRLAANDSHIHVLENNHIEIQGVHFLGCSLWTDFQLYGKKTTCILKAKNGMNDYRVIQNGMLDRPLHPEDTIAIHVESLSWLKSMIDQYKNEPMVVITHHAPSMKSVADMYQADLLTAAFASELSEVVANSGAALWIHGHTHNAVDYVLGNTRVVCNPRGYPRERTGFNPDLVIQI